MKVLIVTHYFKPHVGGIEIVAYNQAKELVKLGHDVTIVTSKIGKENEKELIKGIKVIRIKAWNFFERYMDVPYPIFSPELLLVLKKEIESTGIVHIHSLLYMSSPFGALISKLCRKPLILTQHIKRVKTKKFVVGIIQTLVFLTYGRIILNLSDRIIICNEYLKEWLNRDEKIRFLENSVDTSLFRLSKNKKELRKKYNLPLNNKIVLFVGRLVEKKGFDKLFEARDKDYLIVFVGEGIVPENMKNNKNVMFIKSLPQEKLSEIYQASDIFVLPSKNEGFPLTILEAMASGLPIITSNHPGYDRYLDKKYVRLINPTSKHIKKAIKETLGSESLMKKMSRYSRTTAVKRFSWNKNVKGLLSIYQEALK